MFTLKISYFTSKHGCISEKENCHSGQASYRKAIGKTNKGEECYLMEKAEVGRGCLELESSG